MDNLEKKFKELLGSARTLYTFHPFFSAILSTLRHLEVHFNEKRETACIITSKRGDRRIEISPKFFETFVKTPQDILFLLSHEILHHLLGHLSPEGIRLKRTFGQKVSNIAGDIVINQFIYFHFGHEVKGLNILHFYGEVSKCPNFMFVPQRTVTEANIKGERCKEWHRKLRTLQHSEDVKFLTRETYNIAEHILKHQVKKGEIREICESEGEAPSIPDILKEILKKVLGYSPFGIGREEEIRKAKARFKENLLSAIREMGEDEEGSMEGLSRGGGVLPYYARKDFLFLSLGVPTLIYHANPFMEEQKGIRLYVDVSGSVHDDLPFMFYAIDAIKNYIVFPIYGFSTEVFPISRSELMKGRYRTTGGTDFNCIAEHLIKQRFNRVIIITDGWASISRKNANILKKNFQILTLLTKDGRESTIKKFSWRWIKFELKEESLTSPF